MQRDIRDTRDIRDARDRKDFFANSAIFAGKKTFKPSNLEYGLVLH